MNRLLILCSMVVMSIASLAQNPSSEPLPVSPFSYGLTPMLHQTIVSDPFVSNLGVGLGFYGAYLLRTDFSISSSLEYNNLRYKDDENFNSLSSNDISLKIGVKRHFKKLDNSALILQFAPAYNFSYKREYTGTNNVGPKSTNLYPLLDNKLSLGIYAGLELDFKSKSSIQFGYRHILNSNNELTYIDALPHNITLGYNISFSVKSNRTRWWKEKNKTLAQLSKDTLYIINRTCLDKFSADQIDSVFKLHYSFSAFKILKDEDVEHVKKQPNVVHFAVLGRYYASKGDPATNGIYLLDKNLNLTQHPYPYYTADPFSFLDSKMCIETLLNLAFIVKRFNYNIGGGS